MMHMTSTERGKTLCGVTAGEMADDVELVTCRACETLLLYGMAVTELARQADEVGRVFRVDPKTVARDTEHARLTLLKLRVDANKKAN